MIGGGRAMKEQPDLQPDNTSGEQPADELLLKVAGLIGRLWRDGGLESRLLATPREVLVEAGLPLPEGVKVEVALDSENRRHLVLPPPGHPRRGVIEKVVEKLRRDSAAAEMTILEDRPDLIHFVLPAPPPNVDLTSLDEEQVIVLAARSSLGEAAAGRDAE